VKACPAMASLLVVRTSTDPPKRQVNRIRFGDHQATEVEFLALRSIDGPLIEPRNDFRRDILDDSPPMVIVGRASHYSPAAWQRIEDQISGPVSGSGCDLRCPRGRVSRLAVAGDRVGWATTGSARECP